MKTLILQLDGKRGPTTISVNNIGSIRTQHSAGHSIGLGATIGAASGGILAAIGNAKGGEDDYFDPGEIAIIFTLLGATTGAVAGTITAVAQNPHHYSIEGDPDKWKEFQTMVSAFNADRKKDKTASIF